MTEVQKRKKGQILNNNERQLILNLMHYLKEKNAGKSVSEVIREISKATGCSERTIYKIRKDASKGITVIPNKSRIRKKENKNSRNVKYDSFVKSSIRKKIHSYFLQNVTPTLNTILCFVNNDPNLPNFKRSTLHTLLKEIGFVYEQKGKKTLLTEKCDSVKFRQEYLKNIRQFRNENRWIFYTGETLMSVMKKEVQKEEDNFAHINSIDPLLVAAPENCEPVNTILLNSTDIVTGATLVYTIDANSLANSIGETTLDLNGTLLSNVQPIGSNASNIPVHTILNENSYLFGESSKNTKEINQSKDSRELRFSIMHAGSDAGFLEGVEHIVLSKKNNEEIDNYEKWFIEKLLPKIPSNSVVVIDNNAPYHRKKEETIPDGSWKKHQIKNWLISKNVCIPDLNQKKDLLALVNDLRSFHSTAHKLVELAKEKGITLLNLPPYHYELNPLNMVWSQVKCHVRSNMKSFKIKKIKQLVKDGFFTVTDWMNHIHHVREMEDLLWTVDSIHETDQVEKSSMQ